MTAGLPAWCSTEWLEVLDEEQHVMSFSVVASDHRLVNYRLTLTVYEAAAGLGRRGVVVIEPYVTDMPPGNTEEETCLFTGSIFRCTLKSLASVAESGGSIPQVEDKKTIIDTPAFVFK